MGLSACGGDDGGPEVPNAAEPTEDLGTPNNTDDMGPDADPMMNPEVRDCIEDVDCEVVEDDEPCPDGFAQKSLTPSPPVICQREEANVPPPATDTCENLRVIEGEWFRLGSFWDSNLGEHVDRPMLDNPMYLHLNPLSNDCQLTSDGRGALLEGAIYFGTELPLHYEEDGAWIEVELDGDGVLTERISATPEGDITEVFYARGN